MTMVRHVLPPVFAQLAILATLDIGHMMMHVSGFSFLGLGVRPPTPEWGVMFALALALDVDSLLADEATTDLDAVSQRRVLDLVASLVRDRSLGVLCRWSFRMSWAL